RDRSGFVVAGSRCAQQHAVLHARLRLAAGRRRLGHGIGGIAMKHILFVTGVCMALVVACSSDYTTEPYSITVNAPNFVAGIDNPYYPLTPGKRFRYEGETTDGHETNTVTVSNQTYNILGIACTVVEDTVLVDGEMIEATTDWFAQDKDGTVWYMGEAS